MNSIRHVYLENAQLFRALVENPEELAPLYRRAARAVASGGGTRAAKAVGELAALQESWVVS